MLKILPNGYIKGGSMDVAYDPETKNLRFVGHVKIGISILTKTFSFDKSQSVPQDFMRSAYFIEGSKPKVGELEFEVIARIGNLATVAFRHGQDSGVFNANLEKEYAEITKIVVNTSYSGKTIRVEAVKI